MAFSAKLEDFYTKYILGVGGENRVKMPYTLLAFGPWGVLAGNFGRFWRVGALFAAIMSLTSLLLENAYICRYVGWEDMNANCGGSEISFLLGMFLLLFLSSAFAVCWRQVLAGEKYSWPNMLNPLRKTAKFFGLSLIFIFLFSIPFISFFILMLRIPNPDWRIEICFFAVVSLGFLVPFAAIRFLSLFAFVLNGEQMPPLGRIWLQSRGNVLLILLSLFLILVGNLFFWSAFRQSFAGTATADSFTSALFVEFFNSFFSLMFFTLLLNHCFLQKSCLDKASENA